MEKEIWKTIEGYENYMVSNLGRVKSLKFSKEKILKQVKDKNNYCRVCLYKDKKLKHYLVHRLVATVFIPNLNNYCVVNHRDENPQNNNVNNLEWVTQKYNVNYGKRNEKLSIAHKGKKHTQEHIEKCVKAQLKPIVQLSLNGEFIKKWDSAKQVKLELGFSNNNICTCLKGKTKSAGKYKWKYLSDYINEQIQYINELKEYRNRLYDILKKVS